jgi:hypothetical protein
MINGQSYGWTDVKINLLGRTLEGVSAIEYEDNVEMKNNIGKGNMPVSQTLGKYEAKASITIDMKEHTALLQALPAGVRLQHIASFDIIVMFEDKNDTSKPIIKDIIRHCRFTGNKRELKVGSDSPEMKMELLVGCIDWKQA